MENNKIINPFFDASLSMEERLDWLLSELTMDEKLKFMSSGAPDIERLGIKGMCLGGEAAHGVEARNDQNGIGEADASTSFPQPIGMSATWDTELIKQAGEVTGIESRIVYHRHPQAGISRWAPTIDLARDPRWGRTEECYGEDPVLTGAMASAYIRGMQGDHPKYLRTASTLKHFYANNTELGRNWKNASIDPRNRYELYLEPFRRAITEGGAEGVMTAYNRINGVPGMLNPEVQEILKDEYGVTHTVCDGFAMNLIVSQHHYFGLYSEAFAAAVKAGVDNMTDSPELVEQAAREAYELGLLTEADFDRAIRNVFRTKLRLGIYDAFPDNPYDQVKDEEMNSERHQTICKNVSRASVVLLRNDQQILPLPKNTKAKSLAVIGPVADSWFQDWYCGKPYRQTTLYEELTGLLKGKPDYTDGCDRVTFRIGRQGLAVDKDQNIVLSKTPDVFLLQDWGEGSYTIRCERTGKYMNASLEWEGPISTASGTIKADRDTVFTWFVTEQFHIERLSDGKVHLSNRFYSPFVVNKNGSVEAIKDAIPADFTMEIVEDGIQEAVNAAKGKDRVILALGCHPMINAREDVDRSTIQLPERQQLLLDQVYKANPNVILVLFSNYPYAAKGAFGKVPAILWSATGSQEMGSAMAETILGHSAPAGRLNLTWYAKDEQLPDIDDYDIIRGKRTYRYFDGDVLFPFGYGLTYSKFSYSDFKVSLKDKIWIVVSLKLTNDGKYTSDEVVQIYGTAPKSRVPKPIRQLLGFTRVKDIAPGESRQVTLTIPVEEFRFYDVISRKLMVEEGVYRVELCSSARDVLLSEELLIPGRKTGLREGTKRTAADHFDDCINAELVEGALGFTAVTALNKKKECILTYRDFAPEQWNDLHLFLKSAQGCSIQVLINGKKAGEWQGETRTYEPARNVFPSPEIQKDNRDRIAQLQPIFADIVVPLDNKNSRKPKNPVDLQLVVKGDFKLCFLKFTPKQPAPKK